VFAEPPRTPYDLNFRLLGFPVRVHPFFWLAAALLGANALKGGLQYLLIWIAVVFVSILVHELGHALAIRRFGSDSRIVLWCFGGLAIPYSSAGRRWKQIAIALAGPTAGFILCGLVYGSDQLWHWGSNAKVLPINYLYIALFEVNLVWGIFNLLPVIPLDGGQVTRELCEGKWRGRGLQVALKISVGFAAAVTLYCALRWIEARQGGGPLTDHLPSWFPHGSLYTAVLFAVLAVQNYQYLQQVGRGYYYDPPDDRVPWEK
jgi:stage IV sporulation protein FB